MNENTKTVAVVSYIFFIGWIVALVLHSNEQEKSSLASFHLRQSLGIHITGLIIWCANIVLIFIPFIGWLISFCLGIGLLIIWILGIIAASNAEEKTVPIVGNTFQELFSGIN
jgi:uncharacterized membrane protein